ncbi:MAG: DNA polymerase III subunit beta [Azospirillaceae bacterium]
MKLIIERAQLLKSLGHVQSVVERRTTIPILSNVLIRVESGTLSLTATDMDLEIVESIPVDVVATGATTAPAHMLYDIVRKLPDGSQVEIVHDTGASTLTLRAGRSRFQLGCLPVEDYPSVGSGDLPVSFTLSAGDLSGLIDRTRFAISTEETRYYLNGIYFHAAKEEETPMLRAVATDGHRLARMEMPLPTGADAMPGVIVPRKTVTELRKLVDEIDGDVTVSLSDAKIRFEAGKVVLTSKLIDGTFPDYERVIPAGNDKVMEVDAKTFADAVDRVSTIATEKSRAVKLSLTEGNLTLSATSAEQGSATEEVEVAYSAEPMEIGFNARYLLDITQQIEGDGARFVLADAASPTIIRDVADSSAIYVLMPMRV